ncbi:MAG: type II toxin-antitoxin system VapC family toxin [Myxococcales bacterium]|nr:type II toxin-antitoxin system VapC family toxin [Myxococcales bacterium]
MKFVADTHIVIWWYEANEALSAVDLRRLRTAEAHGPAVGVSAISLWEIALLHSRGRIALDLPLDEYLSRIEASPTFQVLPLEGRIAAESTRLGPAFPRDPVDRLVAATTRCHGLLLMTADESIRKSGVVALA